MHIVLFDRAEWRKQLYPLTLTRPVGDLRIGIVTIAEKWAKWLNSTFSFLTEDYLQETFPLSAAQQDIGEFLVVRADVLPDARLCEQVAALRVGEGLSDTAGWMIIKIDGAGFELFCSTLGAAEIQVDLNRYPHPVRRICYPEDLFLHNESELEQDFQLLTKGRVSATLSNTNRILGDRIFVEEGATAECSVFNTTTGPIYLGKDSEVWEGSMIRGGFALGEGSQVKMGARIYQAVTVGPHCRVGGEINNSVIWGYSSKGHDGFLGSAVVGAWCNWGADTNNSNLKNSYKDVKVYDYARRGFRDTGRQFYGLIMGDHSKTAINTAFNTGTVVGVGANVFGGGFPPAFIPDFTWGGRDGFQVHQLERMMETAALVFARRNRTFDRADRRLLEHVFELTKSYRKI